MFSFDSGGNLGSSHSEEDDIPRPSTPTLAATPSTSVKAPLTAASTVVHANSSSTSNAAPKARVERGFSQMEWMRVARAKAQSAGLQGGVLRKNISMEEVKQHNKSDDAWMVLKNKVYDITAYLPYHPGGAKILLKVAGKDGMALFNKYHPWVNFEAILDQCLIGTLEPRDMAAGPDTGGHKTSSGDVAH